MAMLFEEENASLFGPVATVALPGNFESLSKEEKEKAKQSVKDAKDLIKGPEKGDGKSERDKAELLQGCCGW